MPCWTMPACEVYTNFTGVNILAAVDVGGVCLIGLCLGCLVTMRNVTIQYLYVFTCGISDLRYFYS